MTQVEVPRKRPGRGGGGARVGRSGAKLDPKLRPGRRGRHGSLARL